MKQGIEQRRKSGIPEVLVQRRHGSRFDFPAEPVAHHDVISFAQFFHEARHIREIVAVVRISHDDEPYRKSTRLNSSHQIISYAVFCLKKKKWTQELI